MSLKETKPQQWDRLFHLAIRKGQTRQEAVETATRLLGFNPTKEPPVRLVQGGLCRGR